MFRLLQEWSAVIFVAGGVMLCKGASRGDPVSLAPGAVTTLVGLFFLAYRRWYNLSWLAVLVGGSLLLFGATGGNVSLEQSIQASTVPLVGTGAVLVVGGLISFSLLYRVCSRRDRDCSYQGR